ncbi:MAG TPA: M20/M25/M40 family metallo-hydrolase [Nannocystaceae bacterium]|nr:M20/M25/M40 family metallo-hydrolase [Nannocystaceae bacterium]
MTSAAFLRACIVAAIATSACERGGPTTRPPQPQVREAAKPVLDAAWMHAFLARFSDDAMAGRFTLDVPAIDRAAKMIEDEYVALGVKPVGDAYRVPFDFPWGSEPMRAHHVWLEAGGPAQPLAAEAITTITTAGNAPVVAQVVFVGHGTAPKKRAALPAPAIALALDHAKGSTAPLSAEELDALIVRQQDAGMQALVLVDGEAAPSELARAREAVADARKIPVLVLSRTAAEGLLASAGLDLAEARKLAAKAALARPLEGVRLSIAPRNQPKTEHGKNVLAWIPGTERPHEIVLVGAHYDHIGTAANGLFCRDAEGDTLCNGADDNGSGTAMVLAIARALTTSGAKPQRSIVFAHFAAEELGLHGSKALAKALPAAPPFAGGELVAMINFDMVGRLGDDGLSIGGVGSSDGWMPVLDRIGTKGVPIVYERTVSSRSDQAPFYEQEVPVLFFFTGLHDDYHRPNDELEKINQAGMAKIGALALELVVAVGDGAELPFHAPGEHEGLVGRMPGSDERTVEKRVGTPAR